MATTVAERLAWARKDAGFSDATTAAREHGWPIPTYLSHENGSRNPPAARLKVYAHTYRVSLPWLRDGTGQPKGEAQIVGYVGGGYEIFSIDDHAQGAGLGPEDLPPAERDIVVALEVRGDSMAPKFGPGDLIYYVRDGEPIDDGLLGLNCVVRTADGRTFIKIIERGAEPGTFTLLSFNAPAMRDVRLEWAAPVRWTKHAQPSRRQPKALRNAAAR